MKYNRIISLVILLCKFSVGFAQEFNFQLYFQDSAGNKDTLTLGYDPLGTDGIDVQFGEVNIIDIPLNSEFDIRISDEWQNRFLYNNPGSFHTKKQIIRKADCGILYSVNSIDIFTDNWPVTVTWDNTLFIDTCLNASLFTSVIPYGWWDTPGFIYFLKETNSVSFAPNEPYFSDYYNYINNNNDTIDVFWQTFGDSSVLISKVMDVDQLINFTVYPNPSSAGITIESKDYTKIRKLNLYDITSKLINEIEMKSAKKTVFPDRGVYLIKCIFVDGTEITQKVIIR